MLKFKNWIFWIKLSSIVNKFKYYQSKSGRLTVVKLSVVFSLLILVASIYMVVRGIKNHLPISSITANVKPVRGASGDFWADVILGQPDFNEGAVKERVGYKVNNPGGVVVDRNFHPNRVYVSDNANSRILAYRSLGFCDSYDEIECTTDNDCLSSTHCILQPNKPADLIIGQPNVYSAACNGDSGYQNYPERSTPTAESLCGMPESGISPLENGVFVEFDVDSSGNLYYPDWINNRVLKYNNPLSTDRIADDVWGQENFFSNNCNQGNPNPSASTLCLGIDGLINDSAVIGLDIDPLGNLWVVDGGNNRILRYKYNPKTRAVSHTADLVLGQPDFNHSSPGNGLNQLRYPATVKIANNKDVFVADTHNDRILRYSYPQTNGMNGQLWGQNFDYPAALEFDVETDGLWVADFYHRMLELWNIEGTEVRKVLFKDIYSFEPRNATCSSPVNICTLNDNRGSIGITDKGDLLLSSSNGEQGMVRFPAPIPTPREGILPAADFRFFYPPAGHNLLTGRSFGSPSGAVVSDNQLIFTDAFRILFWNNPLSVKSWQIADGVVGAPDFYSENAHIYGRAMFDAIGHLYVTHRISIEIFNLPLTTGAEPIKVLGREFLNLEGDPVDFNLNGDYVGSGIYPSADGKFLWLTHPPTNRAVRIRNPLTEPVVDIILGQKSAEGTECNRGGLKDATTLCSPGSVVLDNFDNVYISDDWFEVSGNGRLLEFDAGQFPRDNRETIYAPAADRILLDGKHVFQPAFDSQNRMVIGYNSYNYHNSRHSLDYFENILTDPNPSGSFEDYYVMPATTFFDDSDNLYVVDTNRWKLNIYFYPFAIPVPTPSFDTPSSTGTFQPSFPITTATGIASPTESPAADSIRDQKPKNNR